MRLSKIESALSTPAFARGAHPRNRAVSSNKEACWRIFPAHWRLRGAGLLTFDWLSSVVLTRSTTD